MTTPTLAEVLRQAIDSRICDVHTSLPGRVVSYDRSTQRADIEIVVRSAVETSDGSYAEEELPVLPDVPIAWLRGGGVSLQLPLRAGDHVWVMFSEVALGNWRVSGQTSSPGDISRHSLSYPVAIPCLAPDTEPLPAAGGSEAAFDVPGGMTLRVGGTAAQAVALAPLVSAVLNALKAAVAKAADKEKASGMYGMAALKTELDSWSTEVAAKKLKAE